MFSATWCEPEQNEIQKREGMETLKKSRVEENEKNQFRDASPRGKKFSRALILRVIQSVSKK